jgi:hypothetical protein
MLRNILLPALAAIAVVGPANAQNRAPSRDDLLDALTRHIQICSEISDSQGRLACYDKLQTQVGSVQPSAPATPAPTPLRPAAPPPAQAQGAQPGNPQPLAPPPLNVPGGGNAVIGTGPGAGPGNTTSSDPDRAFDPNSAMSGYRPPEGLAPKPQPQVRRTGPRPIPNFANPMPLVSLAASNLTYGEARYWQVTIAITSNTPRTLDTQIRCTFMNAGRPVAEAYFGPTAIAPGEQISTELIGPPTTAFVDSTRCNVLSP